MTRYAGLSIRKKLGSVKNVVDRISFSNSTQSTSHAGNLEVIEYELPSRVVTHARVPLIAAWVGGIVGSMVLVMIILFTFIAVDKVITAQGIVISKVPDQLVQAIEPSVIKAVYVRTGQRVSSGELLAELDPTFVTADRGSIENQLFGIEARIARLKAELNKESFDGKAFGKDGELQATLYFYRKGEFEARLNSYDRKLSELSSVLKKFESDAVTLNERLTLAQNIETMRRDLEKKKVGTKVASIAATDARTEIEGLLSSARFSSEATRQSIANLESERNGYIQAWYSDVSQKLSDDEVLRNSLREEMAKANRRNELVKIRAQADGVVQSISQLSAGSVLPPAQTLMTIVADLNSLEIEANVSGRDSGFVKTGDIVSIKFEALPFSTYGMYMGVVRTVSPDSFTPQKEMKNQTGSVPLSGSEWPYYRVKISLDQSKLRNLPEDFRIVPGMPVVADIKIGERSVMSYFLQSMIPVIKEGFREP